MIAVEAGLVTQGESAQSIYHATRRHARHTELAPTLQSPEIIARNFCGFAALASAINSLHNEPLITAQQRDESIGIGELVNLVLLQHGTPHPVLPIWKALDQDGNSYHHALISAAAGLAVQAAAKQNFKSVEEFAGFLTDNTALLLSVKNTFINEHTLPRQHKPPVQLQEGTHILALLGYSQDTQTYTVFDPYGNAELMQLSADELNRFRPQTPRAIALAKEEQRFDAIGHLEDTQIFPNEYVRRTVEALTGARLRKV